MQETAACRLILVLDREIRSRGHGSIRAVDRAMGRTGGWWQQRVAAGDLSLGQLLKVLDHLGLEPVRFCRKVLGGEDGPDLDRPRGEPPEIVLRARDRLRAGTEGKGIGKTYLETLDQQRYEEPERVVKLALWAVDHVELPLLPRLLGVVGSALRLLLRLDDAEHAIHAGIEIVQGRDAQTVVGDLLQRLSYVVADQGDHAEALRLAEKEVMTYLRVGDRIGLGKALVDSGMWLYYLDQPRESINTQEAALERLPDSLPRSRCTAFQFIGLSYRRLGDPESAIKYLRKAEATAVGIEDWAMAKLTWLKGEIHMDLGQFDEAASDLWKVVEFFRERHPGETVLAACDLVRVQLLQGRLADAYQTATLISALAEPLRHNRIISAAIGDLSRCGQAGLTLALVEQVKARIKSQGKQFRRWQLPDPNDSDRRIRRLGAAADPLAIERLEPASGPPPDQRSGRAPHPSAQQLVQALDREIRRRGRGSIRAVDRVAGRGEGWWQHRVEAGALTLHQLLTVLDHLSLEPVRFFRRILPAEPPGLRLDRPRGEPPAIVARSWDRIQAGEKGKGIGESYLDTLDRQRYEEPEEVIKLALWAVDHVELPLLPRLLGVAGSACRLLIHLDEAEHTIHAGLDIAQRGDDQAALGDLLQRLSYVLADRGEHGEALRLAEKAAMRYLRMGDHAGLGRALVAQGIWLYYLDRCKEAIVVQETALRHLPAHEEPHRFTVFQALGSCHRRLGNLENALHYVTLAGELTPDRNAEGKLCWLLASIYQDLNQLMEAECQLRKVVEIFKNLHYGETALSTCDLVRIQLLQGRVVDAYHTATSMRALLEPLRHNKIISAAIGDLLRSGQAGLTLALVKRVKAQIRSERKHPQLWRSLRVGQA
ncbi:MAG: tetratricopeptide repeat protein [bacterium]|nr:tetratricopeptide repeat protein [bacterium]